MSRRQRAIGMWACVFVVGVLLIPLAWLGDASGKQTRIIAASITMGVSVLVIIVLSTRFLLKFRTSTASSIALSLSITLSSILLNVLGYIALNATSFGNSNPITTTTSSSSSPQSISSSAENGVNSDYENFLFEADLSMNLRYFFGMLNAINFTHTAPRLSNSNRFSKSSKSTNKSTPQKFASTPSSLIDFESLIGVRLQRNIGFLFGVLLWVFQPSNKLATHFLCATFFVPVLLILLPMFGFIGKEEIFMMEIRQRTKSQRRMIKSGNANGNCSDELNDAVDDNDEDAGVSDGSAAAEQAAAAAAEGMLLSANHSTHKLLEILCRFSNLSIVVFSPKPMSVVHISKELEKLLRINTKKARVSFDENDAAEPTATATVAFDVSEQINTALDAITLGEDMSLRTHLQRIMEVWYEDAAISNSFEEICERDRIYSLSNCIINDQRHLLYIAEISSSAVGCGGANVESQQQEQSPCVMVCFNPQEDSDNFDKYKHKMINSISHDLKTPLNGMILLIDILKDQLQNRILVNNNYNNNNQQTTSQNNNSNNNYHGNFKQSPFFDQGTSQMFLQTNTMISSNPQPIFNSLQQQQQSQLSQQQAQQLSQQPVPHSSKNAQQAGQSNSNKSHLDVKSPMQESHRKLFQRQSFSLNYQFTGDFPDSPPALKQEKGGSATSGTEIKFPLVQTGQKIDGIAGGIGATQQSIVSPNAVVASQNSPPTIKPAIGIAQTNNNNNLAISKGISSILHQHQNQQQQQQQYNSVTNIGLQFEQNVGGVNTGGTGAAGIATLVSLIPSQTHLRSAEQIPYMSTNLIPLQELDNEDEEQEDMLQHDEEWIQSCHKQAKLHNHLYHKNTDVKLSRHSRGSIRQSSAIELNGPRARKKKNNTIIETVITMKSNDVNHRKQQQQLFSPEHLRLKKAKSRTTVRQNTHDSAAATDSHSLEFMNETPHSRQKLVLHHSRFPIEQFDQTIEKTPKWVYQNHLQSSSSNNININNNNNNNEVSNSAFNRQIEQSFPQAEEVEEEEHNFDLERSQRSSNSSNGKNKNLLQKKQNHHSRSNNSNAITSHIMFKDLTAQRKNNSSSKDLLRIRETSMKDMVINEDEDEHVAAILPDFNENLKSQYEQKIIPSANNDHNDIGDTDSVNLKSMLDQLKLREEEQKESKRNFAVLSFPSKDIQSSQKLFAAGDVQDFELTEFQCGTDSYMLNKQEIPNLQPRTSIKVTEVSNTSSLQNQNQQLLHRQSTQQQQQYAQQQEQQQQQQHQSQSASSSAAVTIPQLINSESNNNNNTNEATHENMNMQNMKISKTNEITPSFSALPVNEMTFYLNPVSKHNSKVSEKKGLSMMSMHENEKEASSGNPNHQLLNQQQQQCENLESKQLKATTLASINWQAIENPAPTFTIPLLKLNHSEPGPMILFNAGEQQQQSQQQQQVALSQLQSLNVPLLSQQQQNSIMTRTVTGSNINSSAQTFMTSPQVLNLGVQPNGGSTSSRDIRIVYHYICLIERNGYLLESRINDLIDYSMLLSKNDLSLSCASFDIMEILNQMKELFGFQARRRKIKLIIPNVHIMLKNDKPRIKQILINILGNAIKFTFEGFIRVMISNAVIGSSNILNITIQDTGIGIPDHIQENLLNFNEHIRSVKDDNRQGVGIGLEICNRLCKIVGPFDSELQIESRMNEGSTLSFGVYLNHPLYQEERDLSSSRPTLQRKKQSKMHSEVTIPSDSELAKHENQIQIPMFRTQNSFAQATFTAVSTTMAPEGTQNANQITNNRTAVFYPNQQNAALSSAPTTLKYIDGKQILPYKTQSTVLPVSLEVIRSSREQFDRSSSMIGGAGGASDDGPAGGYTDTTGLLLPAHSEQTVLIVDDVAFNLMALKNTLVLIYPRLKIIEAWNGKQAVEEVRRNDGKFDLVIMDINMPIMDGFEAMEIINKEIKEGKLCYVPIIAHTAFDNNEDKQNCFHLGAKGFLPKPVKKFELEKAVRPFLDPPSNNY